MKVKREIKVFDDPIYCDDNYVDCDFLENGTKCLLDDSGAALKLEDGRGLRAFKTKECLRAVGDSKIVSPNTDGFFGFKVQINKCGQWIIGAGMFVKANSEKFIIEKDVVLNILAYPNAYSYIYLSGLSIAPKPEFFQLSQAPLFKSDHWQHDGHILIGLIPPKELVFKGSCEFTIEWKG